MRTILHSDNARDDGFTLIELLIGMAMALLVTAAAVTFLISVMHRQPKTTSSADVIGNARNAVEKITADLRVGKSAKLLNPYELEVEASCAQVGSSAGGKCEVTYLCSEETRECTRSTKPIGSSAGPKETVISGLVSPDVFCVYPTSESEEECGPQIEEGGPSYDEREDKPRYVGVKVELPNYEASEGNVVLEGGAALHNSPWVLER